MNVTCETAYIQNNTKPSKYKRLARKMQKTCKFQPTLAVVLNYTRKQRNTSAGTVAGEKNNELRF